MKKTPLLTILTLALSLFFVTSQVLAGPAISQVAKPGTPGTPPGLQKQHTPGPKNTPGAQATLHAGQHGKPQIYRGTISAISISSLALTLADGSSVTFILTADTRIKIPGPLGSGSTLQVGIQAMVMAFIDENGNLTARSVMAIPGKPTCAHRVGWVTVYSPGVSITIQASDGNLYTFILTADTRILPTERAGELAVGSRVTIIAPRDPSTLGWTTLGIVVHPAGSGAGSQPSTPTTSP